MKHESGLDKSPCEAVRPLLSLMVDGEATSQDIKQAEDHLSACERCMSHYVFLQAMNSALKSVPAEQPSAALFDRIALATYQRPTVWDKIRLFLSPAPTRYALGTVAAMGIVGAVTLPLLNLTGNAPAVNVARSTGAEMSTERNIASAGPSAPAGKGRLANVGRNSSEPASGKTVKTDSGNSVSGNRVASNQVTGHSALSNAAKKIAAEVLSSAASAKVIAANPVVDKGRVRPLGVADGARVASNKTAGTRAVAKGAVDGAKPAVTAVVAKRAAEPKTTPITTMRQIARLNVPTSLTRHTVVSDAASFEPRTVEPTPIPVDGNGISRESRTVARVEQPGPSVTTAVDTVNVAPSSSRFSVRLGNLNAGTGARNMTLEDIGTRRVALDTPDQRFIPMVKAPTSSN